MKKRYIFLLIFILTGLVMYFTNPKIDKHRIAINKTLNEVLVDQKQNIINQNPKVAEILNKVDNETLQSMVKPFVEEALKVEDYKVFSITRLELGDKSYRVGLGLFGKVFIAPQLKERVNENLNKYM